MVETFTVPFGTAMTDRRASVLLRLEF